MARDHEYDRCNHPKECPKHKREHEREVYGVNKYEEKPCHMCGWIHLTGEEECPNGNF